MPDTASGRPSTRRTNPMSEPCSNGCIAVSRTSALDATACQLPWLGTMAPAAELVLPAVRPPLDSRRSAVRAAATPAAAAEVPTITCRRLACHRLGDEPTVA